MAHFAKSRSKADFVTRLNSELVRKVGLLWRYKKFIQLWSLAKMISLFCCRSVSSFNDEKLHKENIVIRLNSELVRKVGLLSRYKKFIHLWSFNWIKAVTKLFLLLHNRFWIFIMGSIFFSFYCRLNSELVRKVGLLYRFKKFLHCWCFKMHFWGVH